MGSGRGRPPLFDGIGRLARIPGFTTPVGHVLSGDRCQPIAELLLEKLNFHLVRHGFGVVCWRLKFGDIDWRDCRVVEDIRDTRLRNGSWTLNRYWAEIGEPPVPGGDQPILVDRQHLALWRDIAVVSEAMILAKRAAGVAAQGPTTDADPGADLHPRRGMPLKPLTGVSATEAGSRGRWAVPI